MKTYLITGSSGLIGSEAVAYFDEQGHRVIGVDNNLRAGFLGPSGDTSWNLERLKSVTRNFESFDFDIRDRAALDQLYEEYRPDAIIHCAAQPSHDLARERPVEDFEVNAVGTLNLLEATRQFVPESPFIFMSTNKVYGDAPNELELTELSARWDYARAENFDGVDETMRIDRSLHSLFGASKTAADLLTQEYGRTYGMATVCFRGGCLTGPSHSGVELHGFVSHLVKMAVSGSRYTVFGYKGKQVRDQLHSFDVVRAFEEFIAAPLPGAVYNLGGGRDNSISILEAFDRVSQLTGTPAKHAYDPENRLGDHICYISDLGRFKADYPGWKVTRSLADIFEEIVEAETEKVS